MSQPPDGFMKVEIVVGTAATENVDMRPPIDEQWEIVWCRAYHDDNGGARACKFNIVDSSAYALNDAASINNGVFKYLYTEVASPERLVINYQRYLRWTVASIGAGKKGYIDALVYKYRAISTTESG